MDGLRIGAITGRLATLAPPLMQQKPAKSCEFVEGQPVTGLAKFSLGDSKSGDQGGS
jgi:hypothetical protein